MAGVDVIHEHRAAGQEAVENLVRVPDELARVLPRHLRGENPEDSNLALAEKRARYDAMTTEQLMKKAAQLEKRMLRAARDLEFEEAARLRDEIRALETA